MGNKCLYLGILCICTGFLMPAGLILIGIHFYNDYTSKYVKRVDVEKREYEKNEYSQEARDSFI